jgi:hypothetical protein
VALHQGVAHRTLNSCGISRECYTLFGSGSAGLGVRAFFNAIGTVLVGIIPFAFGMSMIEQNPEHHALGLCLAIGGGFFVVCGAVVIAVNLLILAVGIAIWGAVLLFVVGVVASGIHWLSGH